ncbi:MAG: hypothetical protein PHU31_06180 [Anaerotignum sp.]|nr:hypothetical protein [Anaerotignum sp.]
MQELAVSSAKNAASKVNKDEAENTKPKGNTKIKGNIAIESEVDKGTKIIIRLHFPWLFPMD